MTGLTETLRNRKYIPEINLPEKTTYRVRFAEEGTYVTDPYGNVYFRTRGKSWTWNGPSNILTEDDTIFRGSERERFFNGIVETAENACRSKSSSLVPQK